MIWQINSEGCNDDGIFRVLNEGVKIRVDRSREEMVGSKMLRSYCDCDCGWDCNSDKWYLIDPSNDHCT